jgi:hypothetical protein
MIETESHVGGQVKFPLCVGFLSKNKIGDVEALLILERDQEGFVHSVYNLPLTNAFTIPQLMTRAQDIHGRQQCAFRLNLEFHGALFSSQGGLCGPTPSPV